MKGNITKAIAGLALMLTLVACKPKDDGNDDVVTAGLLYLVDQTSGNCAMVTRTSSTLYSAQLNVIPKGGCNQATLTGSTLADATVLTQGKYDTAITLATSLGCNSTTITNLTNSKNNVATTNSTAAAQTAFDTTAEKTRFYPIADLRAEGIAPFKVMLGALGFSEAEILALNLLDVNLFKNLNYTSLIATAAASATDTACVTAVTNKIATDFSGVLMLDATANTKAKISKLAVGACTYGSSSTATNTCATLNTQF